MLGWGRVVNAPVCRGLSKYSSAGVSSACCCAACWKLGPGLPSVLTMPSDNKLNMVWLWSGG